MNESLKSHIEKIDKLPTLPAIAYEILNIIDDALVSVNKLVRIIENDPAISAKLLSVANSAFFGFREPARTLNTAIIRIGFDNVKNIALGISIMTVLDGGRHQKALDYRRIFNHSVAVGFVAKLLSGHFKLTATDEILIPGLLHDMGLLILGRYFPDRYLTVLNALDSEKDLLVVEKEVFNFTHADIGSWPAEKWKLPDTVLDTILYHHNPAQAQNNFRHVAIVHIADYLSTLHIIRATERDYNLAFDPSCLDMLGISENDLTEIVAEIKDGSFFKGLFVS